MYIGGPHPLPAFGLIVVLHSNHGALFQVKVNPLNLRVELHFWETKNPGMTIWEQLESWVGPD